MRSPWRALPARACLCLLLASCAVPAVAPAATAPPAPSASPPPSAAPSVTPHLDAGVPELALLETGEGLEVVGVVQNDSVLDVTGVWLRVGLFDVGGTPLAEQVVPLGQTYLGAGERAPFRALFGPLTSARRAGAEVAAYQAASFQRVDVDVGLARSFPTEKGHLEVLGEIGAPGDLFASVETLSLIARDAEGRIVGLAGYGAGPSLLAPGETYPFSALLNDQTDEALEFEPFVDAATAHPPGGYDFVFDPGPEVAWDAQGNVFVVGGIRNAGGVARWAGWLVSLWADGELVGLASVASPLPLAPGGNLAYTVSDVPGLLLLLRAGTIHADDLTARAIVDPGSARISGAAPTPLPLDVRGFEDVGSSLLLSGTVRNDAIGAQAAGAVVIAVVRTTGGRLVTAGWVTAAEQLAPGASADFVLALPLPAGTQTTGLEFDVSAYSALP